MLADSSEPLPLMDGEGKSFRVLGFNQQQRAQFVQLLMRSIYQVAIFRNLHLLMISYHFLFLDRVVGEVSDHMLQIWIWQL